MQAPGRLVARLLLLALLLLPAPAGLAQDSAGPVSDGAGSAANSSTGAATPTPPVPAVPAASTVDYGAWNKVAVRAEQALQADRASDQALQTLRAELVTWREVFTKAGAENQVKITTLKKQIDALGPVPEAPGTETASVATQRKDLNTQLEQAQAPVKAAEVALARANSLIDQTDTILRTRQADQLFAIGPTPLNLADWPKAADDLATSARLAWNGVLNSFGTETQRAEFRQAAPFALLLAVVALILLLRSRSWTIRFGDRVRDRWQGPAQVVAGSLISLVQLAAPLAGVLALVEALRFAGFLGLRAQVLVDSFPLFGLAFIFGRWLGNRVFGQAESSWCALNLTPNQRIEGRLDATLLGLLYGLNYMILKLAAYETYSDATTAVLTFPVVVLAGLVLLRMGRLLRAHARAEDLAYEDGAGFIGRTLGLAGLALILVGVGGPVAAAVGYAELGELLIYPTILTMAVVGVLLVLHHFFVNLYALLLKTGADEAGDALVPVLLSFAAATLSIPLLALIWGARPTDLTELWTRFEGGFAIGGTVIAPSTVITFTIVFAIGFAATRLLQGTLRNTILPKTKVDIGGQNAINSGVGYVGISLAALVAITAAGINLSSLAIVAGALSVGIGFGLQNIVSNFVSGIILLIERPIGEGDWIEVGGQMGIVKDISVRSTRIETFDRTDVILPNSDLISGAVTNFTRGNLTGRVIVSVGVAYGTDTKRVEGILRDIALAHPVVAVKPPPTVIFKEFGADSLNFEIRAILRDVNFKLTVLSDMNHEIARRFAEEGIEIPFAQRDIWLRNPEALTGGAPPPPPPEPKPEPKPGKRKQPAEATPSPAQTRAGLEEADMAPPSQDPGDQNDDD